MGDEGSVNQQFLLIFLLFKLFFISHTSFFYYRISPILPELYCLIIDFDVDITCHTLPLARLVKYSYKRIKLFKCLKGFQVTTFGFDEGMM